MLKPSRIAAIVLIYVATCCAWVILGFTVFERTYTSDARLRSSVVSTWGAPQEQQPPRAHFAETVRVKSVKEVEGKEVVEYKKRTKKHPLRLDASDIDVDLGLQHRQKGLLWYSTYTVGFQGDYTFQNPAGNGPEVSFTLCLPAERAVYDSLAMRLDGQELELRHGGKVVHAKGRIEPGGSKVLSVSYRSQGVDTWAYVFGDSVTNVRNFGLHVDTDFNKVDFAENSLSPTAKTQNGDGWSLDWNYGSLLSGYRIKVDMPEKLQPGPLTGRISFFAPVSLLFFFFVLFLITALGNVDLHPMNYFFLAAAFFAFHLLLAYLADHISIHTAFIVSSAVSLFLVVSYLRLVAGARFALFQAGGAQLLYLILFSYAFFFEGFTGLTITVGAILTLFVTMQVTGKIRWGQQQTKAEVQAA